MSYINIIAATRRRGQRVLTMCAKLGTENGNMARLVHNLPLHSVRSGAVLSRGGFRHTYIVGLTLWPIFESAERNWRERVRQFGQSWSWIEKERESGRCDRDTRGRREGRHWPHGAPSLDVSKCYRCRAARHLLLFYRGERGYCLSQELHRKRCMNNMNAVRRVQSLSSRPIMCAHSILCIRRIKRRIGSRGATD